MDLEVTEQEQQRYITFLTQIPDIYSKLKHWPSPRQQMLVLAVAACVSQNEKIFLKVHSAGAYKALVKMSRVSQTSSLVKIRYLDMLCAFFEHDSGLRWSLETNHWIDVYKLVLECQEDGPCVGEKVHNILSKFLQKTSKVAPKVCWHVTRQMVQTVTQTAHKLVGKTKKQPMELMTQSETDRLLPSAVCLVESLERLLASPVTDTLRYFIKLGVQEASTTMALLSNDSQLSLCVNRILVILSFYEMTELFDGIKVVNHDPIALSGFLKIIERELKKGHLEAIFELFYFAQKYWKSVSRKMPQYFVKGKAIDIEDELMSFQVEPLVIIAEKLLGVPQTCEEEVRNCYLADILNVYSTEGLQLGYEIREKLNLAPLNVEIAALKCIVKSKSMYSRKNLAIVFQALTYALRDFIKYATKDKQEVDQDQNFAQMLLEAILVYLENFDLSWRESIGSVELTNLVYEFLLLTSKWNPEVVLKALKTLNITISKHMCPNMALLVDTTQSSTLNNLASMLYKKCFNSNSEVRDAALRVVCTICQKVNQGFSSFKQILDECLTPDLILSMAHSDLDWSVRASALKCLQEMILMEGIGGSLLATGFVEKILKITASEQEPFVLKEAINVLSKIYQSECYSGFKIYNVMVQVVFSGPGGVQEEAVRFWEDRKSVV